MSNRTFTITLDERHVQMFLHFASMRRTLTEAQRLIEGESRPCSEWDLTLGELEAIIPAIEAAQFAIRDGARA